MNDALVGVAGDHWSKIVIELGSPPRPLDLGEVAQVELKIERDGTMLFEDRVPYDDQSRVELGRYIERFGLGTFQVSFHIRWPDGGLFVEPRTVEVME